MNQKTLHKKWFDYSPRVVSGRVVEFYNSDEITHIKDENGKEIDIAIIYSGRNRGKSFDIMAKAISNSYYKKELFVYARRWKDELTGYNVEQYFQDKIDFIKDMTDGTYTDFLASQGKIYIVSIDPETQKKTNKKQIGYYMDINKSRDKKSLQFPNVTKLIIEEVFTKDNYCPDEPNKVLDLISTLKRNKEDFKSFLISNTVSRYNPYINDWGLSKMYNQKEGTIDLYKMNTTETDMDGNPIYYNIACEYLKGAKSETLTESRINRLLNRNTIKSTLSNKWDVANLYPIIRNKNITCYKELYSCVIYVKGFMYLCRVYRVPSNILELYRDYLENGDNRQVKESLSSMVVIYVERKTTKIKDNERVFTDTPYISNKCSIGFTNMNNQDYGFLRLLREKRVFFSNNLIGNEFYQSIAEFH